MLHRKKVQDVNFIFQKKTKGEQALHIVMIVILSAWCLTFLFPLLWLLIQSLFDRNSYAIDLILYGKFSLPKVWHFENYLDAFSVLEVETGGTKTNFFGMLFNSLWFIAIGETWCLLWPVMVGYIFSKYRFPGRSSLYAVVIFAITVPVIGASGAYYKLIDFFNLYDTGPLFVIITGLGGFESSMLIYYGIFKGISWSYAESVFIDGGGHTRAFFSVMLPQAMPAISAMMVTSLISLWNQYEQFIMYLPSFPTVATGLYYVSLSTNDTPQVLYYSGLIISIVPVLIIYALMAEKMMKNLSIGGLKG